MVSFGSEDDAPVTTAFFVSAVILTTLSCNHEMVIELFQEITGHVVLQ